MNAGPMSCIGIWTELITSQESSFGGNHNANEGKGWQFFLWIRIHCVQIWNLRSCSIAWMRAWMRLQQARIYFYQCERKSDYLGKYAGIILGHCWTKTWEVWSEVSFFDEARLIFWSEKIAYWKIFIQSKWHFTSSVSGGTRNCRDW
jgi:hypothetical protein